jgi:hypothetical protein
MKTILRPIFLSFAASTMVSLPFAAVAEDAGQDMCRDGYELVGSNCIDMTQMRTCHDGSVVHLDQPCDDDSAATQEDPQQIAPGMCATGVGDDIQSNMYRCRDTYSVNAKACDPNQGEFAAAVKEGDKVIAEISAGGPSVKSSSEKLKAFNEKLEQASAAAQAKCQASQTDCERTCQGELNNSNQLVQMNSCGGDPEANAMIEHIENSLAQCQQLSKKVAAFQAAAKSAENQAAKAAEAAAASDGGGAKLAGLEEGVGGGSGGGAVAAAPVPPDDGYSNDYAAGDGSYNDDGNAEDTDDEKKDKKKKKGDLMSGLMSAVAPLIAGFMTPAPTVPQATIDPVQLAETHCARPENFDSTICICKNGMNTPGCLAAANQSNGTQFSSLMPGSGGAQLSGGTSSDGKTLDLGSGAPQMPLEMPPGDPSLNASGGGLIGGGGGFGGGGGNFTPDAPRGRSGSALSADIYAGTRGGTNPFGSGRGVSSYSLRDPEDLPGYNLPKEKEKVNFKGLLPTGAAIAVAAAPTSAYRSISGMSLPQGMHPSSVDIFGVVAERYRLIQDSLYTP